MSILKQKSELNFLNFTQVAILQFNHSEKKTLQIYTSDLREKERDREEEISGAHNCF